MLSAETRVRVFNNKPYQIGGYLINGHEYTVRPNGGFAIMTVDDVLFISASYPYFHTGELVIKDQYNKDVPLEEVGIYIEGKVLPPCEQEIIDMLKSTNKRLEAWLGKLRSDNLLDKSLCMDIGTLASKLDLAVSKLKLLEQYEITPEEYEVANA